MGISEEVVTLTVGRAEALVLFEMLADFYRQPALEINGPAERLAPSANPDPSRTVYYGDMTWEEMMFPFFSVTVDPSVNTKRVIRIIRGKDGDGA